MPITSQWLKVDLQCPQNIVSHLHLAKTDQCSSRMVSLRQLRLYGMSEGCCVGVAHNPSRTPPGDLQLVRGAVITSRRFCGKCTGCPCDNESNSKSLSWSSSVYPVVPRRIWQTTVSSSLISACVDSARPTRRCVLFDGHTTPSAIGVSQPLDHHACGTHYLLN